MSGDEAADVLREAVDALRRGDHLGHPAKDVDGGTVWWMAARNLEADDSNTASRADEWNELLRLHNVSVTRDQLSDDPPETDERASPPRIRSIVRAAGNIDP